MRKVRRRFACVKYIIAKEKATPVVRSPGILPSDFASVLRGSLNVRSCTCSELARFLRAQAKAFATMQSMDGRNSGSRAPSAVQSIAGVAGKARRVAAMDRRDGEAVQGCTV
jgi:hypothetical protein